jgi:hypothetical protein
MKKINEYKYIIAIVVCILAFIFYWYEIKPSNIKSTCLAEAELSSSALYEGNDSKRFEIIDNYYKTCLHRFGL